LRCISNRKTPSSVWFTLTFGNRIHCKWKKHDEIQHAYSVIWPRSDPALPKFKASDTSEKSWTSNMSRLDTLEQPALLNVPACRSCQKITNYLDLNNGLTDTPSELPK
jgi:hypothetical protein